MVMLAALPLPGQTQELPRVATNTENIALPSITDATRDDLYRSLAEVPQDAPLPALTQIKRETTELIHLRQCHAVPDKSNFVDALDSQVKIAVYLKANKDAAIVLEGLTEDYTPEVRKVTAEMQKYAKSCFPAGIPSSSTEMSDSQKQFLYREGAARTMFYLGEIDFIKRSIDPVTSRKIDHEIERYGTETYGGSWHQFIKTDPILNKLIMGDREKAALSEVNQLISEGKTKIVLVFGGAHDFSRHLEKDSKINLSIKDTTISSFESFNGNIGAAMAKYGNLNLQDPTVLALVVTEQTKLLKQVIADNIQLAAWQWQHFVTPDLKIQALVVLDPDSVSEESDFPLSAFKNILARDPGLLQSGTAWLKQHGKE
jgi:hypothetical protein